MIRPALGFVLAVGCSLLVAPGWAVEPDEILPNPALEARARAISGELRCLVCQNQSIDDSDAALARDLRILIREHLSRGETDTEVRAYLVRRYGEFVLLKPPLSGHTAMLWLGPFALLLAAGLALVRTRRRRGAAQEEPLTADEEARIRELSET